jgi:hypothetical protein
MIQVVRLGASFSPAQLRLGVGQKFQLQVLPTLQATIEGVPAHCLAGTVTEIAGGVLSVQCGPGTAYMFTAEHAGSTVVTATVQPRCTPGTVCTDYVVLARLSIEIT